MSEHSLNANGPSRLAVSSGNLHPLNVDAVSPDLVTIKGENHEDLVKVQRDGSVVYGEGVDLDEASRRFWDAIAANIPPTHRSQPATPPQDAIPEAWADLIAALTLLARAGDPVSPLHCEHDTLHVMAHADQFTPEEVAQLDAWGFYVDEDDGLFYSFRFGSA